MGSQPTIIPSRTNLELHANFQAFLLSPGPILHCFTRMATALVYSYIIYIHQREFNAYTIYILPYVVTTYVNAIILFQYTT